VSAALEDLTERTFTPDRTRRLLRKVCRIAGLDPDGAVLLRHQTNAVYRLIATPVVVKIARPTISHVAQVVQLVEWLERCGVPTVSLWDEVEQPLHVAGCAVTFWRYLAQVRKISAVDLAEPLRALHEMPAPAVNIPMHTPFEAIRGSLTSSRLLTADDRKILIDHCDELSSAAENTQYRMTPSVIHGDPQHGNALWDENSDRFVLCDWESATLGPPEWDLVTVEVHCRRFDHPATEYGEFCRRYGMDIRDWASYGWLRDVRELRMISTNARKSPPGTPQAAEVHRRIAALRARKTIRWRIL
jgi:hypothetical protein